MNTMTATETITVSHDSLMDFANALFSDERGALDAWLEVNTDMACRWHFHAFVSNEYLVSQVPKGSYHHASLMLSFMEALSSDEATRIWLEDHQHEDDVRNAIFAYALSTKSSRRTSAKAFSERSIQVLDDLNGLIADAPDDLRPGLQDVAQKLAQLVTKEDAT